MSVFKVVLAGSAPEQKSFEVLQNETVLEASRRAKLALPYSCLSGRCGSCAAKVLSGRWRYAQETSALSAHERVDHALLCQALPETDLVLALKEVEHVAELPIVRCGAELVEKHALGIDVVRILLRTDQPIRYLAGQYLEFVMEDGKKRPFSIANAPAPDAHGLLELHVRRVAGGGFTQTLFDVIQVGHRFELDMPHGTFVARAHSDRPLLFVAGGTGFAPIKALLERFLAPGQADSQSFRPMHLYWGVREAADFYLRDAIAEFQFRNPALRFSQVLSESSPEGGLDTHAIEFLQRYGNLHDVVLNDYPNLTEHDVYMSGPPAMISACRQAFLAAQLPEDRLYFDSFDFAPDVLAALIHARQRAK